MLVKLAPRRPVWIASSAHHPFSWCTKAAPHVRKIQANIATDSMVPIRYYKTCQDDKKNKSPHISNARLPGAYRWRARLPPVIDAWYEVVGKRDVNKMYCLMAKHIALVLFLKSPNLSANAYIYASKIRKHRDVMCKIKSTVCSSYQMEGWMTGMQSYYLIRTSIARNILSSELGTLHRPRVVAEPHDSKFALTRRVLPYVRRSRQRGRSSEKVIAASKSFRRILDVAAAALIMIEGYSLSD
eukprot:scaffold186313_cov34-Prasinocladus_malaysianus.AAC.2